MLPCTRVDPKNTFILSQCRQTRVSPNQVESWHRKSMWWKGDRRAAGWSVSYYIGVSSWQNQISAELLSWLRIPAQHHLTGVSENRFIFIAWCHWSLPVYGNKLEHVESSYEQYDPSHVKPIHDQVQGEGNSRCNIRWASRVTYPFLLSSQEV